MKKGKWLSEDTKSKIRDRFSGVIINANSFKEKFQQKLFTHILHKFNIKIVIATQAVFKLSK